MSVYIIENKPPFNNIITVFTSDDQAKNIADACSYARTFSRRIANAPGDTYVIRYYDYTDGEVKCEKHFREWLLIDEYGRCIQTTPEMRGETQHNKSQKPLYYPELTYRKTKHKKGYMERRDRGEKYNAWQKRTHPRVHNTYRLADDPELDDIAIVRAKAQPPREESWYYHWHKTSKSWKDQSKRKNQYYRLAEF